MSYLASLWPEDIWSLTNVRETSVTLAAGTATSVVAANPYRVALVLSTANGAGATFVSTKSTIAMGQGTPLTTTFAALRFSGRDEWPLAAQAWFAFTANPNIVVTVLESILIRPQPRPANPPQPVVIDSAQADSDVIRRLLKRHAKWRERWQARLESRGVSNGSIYPPGAGLAEPAAVSVRRS